MAIEKVDEAVKEAWDEVTAFYRALEAGTATRADDPQPRLATRLFDLWVAAPDPSRYGGALRAAFMMWANAGSADAIDRALPQLDVHAEYWGGVLRSAGNAYHKAARSGEYLPLLHRYEGKLSDPGSASSLYSMLGGDYLRQGQLEKAASYYRQVVALATDPMAISHGKGALYEIENLQPGHSAPELSGHTIDGEPVRLSDCSGRVVCLDFWATDCGFCWPEMPFLREIRAAWSERGLVMVGISRDQDEQRMRQVVEQEKLSWLQIREPTTFSDGIPRLAPIAAAYNVWGIPRVVLIDRRGTIAAMDLRGQALVDAVRGVM